MSKKLDYNKLLNDSDTKIYRLGFEKSYFGFPLDWI